MFWLTYQQKYTETFIDALHALMIRKDKHCNTYLTFTVLNTRGDRFVMFSVGLFSVFSDALKNNNNCVLNQNTTNEQWFIHVHHSLFLYFAFLHILHDQFLDYVINSMHNYITCKYRDLSFVVNILQKLQYRC